MSGRYSMWWKNDDDETKKKFINRIDFSNAFFAHMKNKRGKSIYLLIFKPTLKSRISANMYGPFSKISSFGLTMSDKITDWLP